MAAQLWRTVWQRKYYRGGWRRGSCSGAENTQLRNTVMALCMQPASYRPLASRMPRHAAMPESSMRKRNAGAVASAVSK